MTKKGVPVSYNYGREDRREATRWLGLSILWWLVILIAITLVSIAIWGITVAVSGVKGQGDAVIEKNSAENWTEAQATFERNYADVIATDIKIDNAYTLWQSDRQDKTLQQTYTGLVSYCLSVVAEYNADARSFLSEEFRAADLPEQINTQGQFADVATDCKENAGE